MRLRSLDALRGVAALIVVIHHVLSTIPGLEEHRSTLFHDGFSSFRGYIYLTPLRIFVSGPSMVILFFIMSGLVLGMTFINKDRGEYAAFAIKRISRIWLPFATIIIVSFFLYIFLGNKVVPGTSDWFINSFWSEKPDLNTLLHHLLMTGKATTLDSPMWSLIIEMQVSLFFHYSL